MDDPSIKRILLDGFFQDDQYGVLAEVAQQGPGSKIIQFSDPRVPPQMLELLWRSWRAPFGSVPKIALVFCFEAFAVWRSIVKVVAKQLAIHGTTLEAFYSNQLFDGRVEAWVRGSEVTHDLGSLLPELAHRARPDEFFGTMVVNAALDLVRTFEPANRGPNMAQMCVIAYRIEGFERAQAMAREALDVIGDSQDLEWLRARARIQRGLGLAMFAQGLDGAARATLEAAVDFVSERGLGTPELVDALQDLSVVAHNMRDFVGAEAIVQRAISLARDHSPDRLATLNYGLACTELYLGRLDLAEVHAGVAHRLNVDPKSIAARQALALRDHVRALRNGSIRA